MTRTAYVNGKIYNMDLCSFEKGTIIVNNGIIEEISDSDNFPDCVTVDLNGAYVIPGLVDIHTHGRAGFDFTGVTPENLSAMLKSYAKAGTTSVMATFASAEIPVYEASIDVINEKRKNPLKNEANILGFHLEGRYINPEKRGAHAAELLAVPNLDEIERLIMRMRPLPTHVVTAPELENGESFIRRAISLGATVSIAHSNSTYDEAVTAVSWGASSFTHLYNAMRSIHHREPGNAAAALLTDSAYAELICDGFHIAPPMIALAQRVKPADKVVLITDSMEAAGCDDGKYNLAGTRVTVKNGLAINHEGTIAGSTLDLFKGMCNFAKFCDIGIQEAIPGATINPARLIFGENPPVGSLESGKKADFIILDSIENPEIQDVYIGGVRIDV